MRVVQSEFVLPEPAGKGGSKMFGNDIPPWSLKQRLMEVKKQQGQLMGKNENKLFALSW